jgi:hypothetical protein
MELFLPFIVYILLITVILLAIKPFSISVLVISLVFMGIAIWGHFRSSKIGYPGPTMLLVCVVLPSLIISGVSFIVFLTSLLITGQVKVTFF